MKISIERSELLKALGHVASVVERRVTIPILGHVKIDVAVGSVSISATDLERMVTERVPAEADRAGSFCVPAIMLHDIARKLPSGGIVNITATDGKVAVRAGSARFNLPTLNAEDFPDAARGETSHRFEMQATDLAKLIGKTRFAISIEEIRYCLNGIYLHAHNDSLRAVATDGHRLAQVDIPLPEGAGGMPSVIIPRKTINEIAKIVDGSTEQIRVAVGGSKIVFQCGNLVLTSKLIDGTYPDYRRVVPQANDQTIRVDKAAFSGAVDRVSTISTERGRGIKLAFEPGLVTLSVASDGSEASETMDIVSESKLEIGFNARYLMDIGSQIDGDVTQIELADAGSPALIRDVADEAVLYVLMPMRV